MKMITMIRFLFVLTITRFLLASKWKGNGQIGGNSQIKNNPHTHSFIHTQSVFLSKRSAPKDLIKYYYLRYKITPSPNRPFDSTSLRSG